LNLKNVVADGVLNKKTTSKISFTLDPDINLTQASAISLQKSDVDAGAVTKGALRKLDSNCTENTSGGCAYEIAISGVETQGNIRMSISAPGRGFSPAQQNVFVNKDLSAPEVYSVLSARDTRYDATIKFNSDEIGEYWYLLTASSDSRPSPQTVMAQGTHVSQLITDPIYANQPNIINLGDTANQCHDDGNGNPSLLNPDTCWNGSAKRVWIVTRDSYPSPHYNTSITPVGIYIPMYSGIESSTQIGGTPEYVSSKSIQIHFREGVETLTKEDINIYGKDDSITSIPESTVIYDVHPNEDMGTIKVASVTPTSNPKIWNINIANVVKAGWLYVTIGKKVAEVDSVTAAGDIIGGIGILQVYKNTLGPELINYLGFRNTLASGGWTITSKNKDANIKWCYQGLVDQSVPNLDTCSTGGSESIPDALIANTAKTKTYNFAADPLGKRVYIVADAYSTDSSTYVDSDTKEIIMPTYVTIDDTRQLDSSGNNIYVNTFGDKNPDHSNVLDTKEVVITLNTPVPGLKLSDFVVGLPSDQAAVELYQNTDSGAADYDKDALTTDDGGKSYHIKLKSVGGENRQRQGQITLGLKHVPGPADIDLQSSTPEYEQETGCNMDMLGFDSIPNCYVLGSPAVTTDNSAFVYADNMPPRITFVSSETTRKSKLTGSVRFNTDENATYYYATCNSATLTGAEVITNSSAAIGGTGSSKLGFATNVNITGFETSAKQYVCFVAVDPNGNISDVDRVQFDAWVTIVADQWLINPDPNGYEPVINGDDAHTTKFIDFMLDSDVTSLTVGTNSGDTGATFGTATKQLTQANEEAIAAGHSIWRLPITSISQTGEATFILTSTGSKFSPATQTIKIFKDITAPIVEATTPVRSDASTATAKFKINEAATYKYIKTTGLPSNKPEKSAFDGLDSVSYSTMNVEVAQAISAIDANQWNLWILATDLDGNQSEITPIHIPAYTTVSFEEYGSDRDATHPTSSTGIKITFSQQVFDLHLDDINMQNGSAAKATKGSVLTPVMDGGNSYKSWIINFATITAAGADFHVDILKETDRYSITDTSNTTNSVRIYYSADAPVLTDITPDRTGGQAATISYKSNKAGTACSYIVVPIDDNTQITTDKFSSSGTACAAPSSGNNSFSLTYVQLTTANVPYRLYYYVKNSNDSSSIYSVMVQDQISL
jgi:hypothetical protein